MAAISYSQLRGIALFLAMVTSEPLGQLPPRVVEFRIHGVGNHVPWHALGRPRQIPGPDVELKAEGSDDPVGFKPNRFVDSFAPPTVDGVSAPDRDLWLLNWARTSRRTARFAWFVAIPFTMVNVAGHMGPKAARAPVARATLMVCTHLTALALSLAAVVWLISLAETALKFMGGWDIYLVLVRLALSLVGALVIYASRSAGLLTRVLAGFAVLVGLAAVWFSELVPALIGAPTSWQESHWVAVYPWVCGAVALGPALLVLARYRRRAQSRTAFSVALAHAMVMGACVLIAVVRPARWPAPSWLPGWATAPPPGTNQCMEAAIHDPAFSCQPTVDVLTLVIVGTTALTLVLAGIVLLSHGLSDEPQGPNLPAAALLLCMAVLTLHTAASVSRVVLGWVMSYVFWLTSFVDPEPRWPTPVAFRVLTPYDSSNFIYRPDLVILVTVAFGLAFGVALGLVLVWALRLRRPDPGATDASAPEASLGHTLVQNLRFMLAPLAAITLPLFLTGVVVVGVVTDDRFALPPWARFAIVLLVQGAAILIALLVSGRLTKAKDVLERFADVAGFWRVHYHPLAGASYRPHVLRGILHEITRSGAERIVIVGHSQGSVLAACVVNRWKEAGDDRTDKYLRHGHEFRLVTCGSPLASLYGTFFPAHFDDDFFKSTRKRSSEEWVNCWRSSDPIASRVPANMNVRLNDPRPPEAVARGHDDYWSDIAQRTIVGMSSDQLTAMFTTKSLPAEIPDTVEFRDEPGTPALPTTDDREQSGRDTANF